MIPRTSLAAFLVLPCLLTLLPNQEPPPSAGSESLSPADRQKRDEVRRQIWEQMTSTPEAREELRFTQEIFFAVLEGLYRDGVQNEVVDRIIAVDEKTGWPENFVYSCPICTPAFDAFRAYRQRPGFSGKKLPMDSFGPGLSEEMVERIGSWDIALRHAAIQELVGGWIRHRMDDLRLSEEERGGWQQEMEKRRKIGMGFLQDYREHGLGRTYAAMKACPFCDAANEASGPR